MVAVIRQYGGMRTRIPITREELLAALEGADGDVQAAAKVLEVSDRTVYRRMDDFGIRVKRRVVSEEAA